MHIIDLHLDAIDPTATRKIAIVHPHPKSPFELHVYVRRGRTVGLWVVGGDEEAPAAGVVTAGAS